MTRQEFEQLAGVQVDPEFYAERMEPVYMRFARFPSKAAFITFFQTHGMRGVESLSDCLEQERKCQAEVDELSQELASLQGRLASAIERLETCQLIYGIEP